MTTGVVVFDATDFKTKYPEFSSIADGVLSNCFDTATLYLDNTEGSRVRDVEKRKPLLYMLTAHIAKLLAGDNNGAATGLVGPISQATEGTVSVTTSLGDLPTGATWFAQTSYGLMFWQATSAWRRFGYVPGASGPSPAPLPYGGRRGW